MTKVKGRLWNSAVLILFFGLCLVLIASELPAQGFDENSYYRLVAKHSGLVLRVGDFIEVGGHSGLVEKVNLKITILRDIAGNVHYIPNGCIDVVTNKTKGFSRYVFEIGVAYREDVDEVIEVMKAVDETLRSDPNFQDDIMNPLEILGLDEFADSAVVIKARSMTKPGRQWAVGREFNRRLKKAFDEKGIEIPYPHLTLYMGQDKSGEAPPIRIKKEDA